MSAIAGDLAVFCPRTVRGGSMRGRPRPGRGLRMKEGSNAAISILKPPENGNTSAKFLGGGFCGGVHALVCHWQPNHNSKIRADLCAK
jgi:hypothetical protein